MSWTGTLFVAAPYLLQHDPLRKMAGILMFPVMLAGPALSAILLIWNVAVRASVGARG
jgi:hypothetical protein